MAVSQRVRVAIGSISSFFAVGLLALVALSLNQVPTKPAGQLTVVYVGAEDCAPCLVWQRGDGAVFRRSSEFARLSYREAKAPTARDLLKDEYWPEDLRRVRRFVSERSAVPLWFVIADDRVVAQGYGVTQWNAVILPKIKSLLD